MTKGARANHLKPGADLISPVIRWVFVILLIAAATVCQAQPLRVITYNVWYGFDRKNNLETGIQWIAKQNCDVVALQELKGFNQSSLAAAAKRWDHPYAVIFDREGGFPQGLSSKFPIEAVEQIQPDGQPGLRGSLFLRTANIYFCVVHFDPRNYLRRQKEAAAVAEKIKPLIAAGKQVIVLGDFNAHSPADETTILNQTGLLENWHQKQKQQKNVRIFDSEGRLDFSVITSLLATGLTDPAKNPLPTFPTTILAPDDSPAEHAGELQRIDYIFVDPVTAGKAPKIHYPRDPVLNKISDHYPVILSIP